MPNSTKQISDRDSGQAIRLSFVDSLSSLSMSDWVSAKVGRKLTYTISTTTVSNDTITIDYLEGAVSLATVKSIYTDGTRTVLISQERLT
jgi:hypothetical protein